jgi:hypothetical protein
VIDFVARKLPDTSPEDIGKVYDYVSKEATISRFLSLHSYLTNEDKQILLKNPTEY